VCGSEKIDVYIFSVEDTGNYSDKYGNGIPIQTVAILISITTVLVDFQVHFGQVRK
jgi:hypothetical protein